MVMMLRNQPPDTPHYLFRSKYLKSLYAHERFTPKPPTGANGTRSRFSKNCRADPASSVALLLEGDDLEFEGLGSGDSIGNQHSIPAGPPGAVVLKGNLTDPELDS